MRILITGLPLFSEKLAKNLSEQDPENKYLFVNTYQSKWEQIRFLLLLPFCSVVISMNGVTDKSGILDWVLFFKKKLILQWMGTDSLTALERYKAGTINRKYIDYAVNTVDCVWMENELKSIQLQPILLHFKFFEKGVIPVEQYEKISVVSYVGQKRQLFYGLDWIIAAANAFPAIQFEIYGMDNPDMECPNNMVFKGWQPMAVFQEAVLKAPIFFRFTVHDGFSVAVLEALSTGAEVLSTQPFELTTMVKSKDLVVEEMDNAIYRIKKRNLKPDLEKIKSASVRFDKPTILSNYIKNIQDLGN